MEVSSDFWGPFVSGRLRGSPSKGSIKPAGSGPEPEFNHDEVATFACAQAGINAFMHDYARTHVSGTVSAYTYDQTFILAQTMLQKQMDA